MKSIHILLLKIRAEIAWAFDNPAKYIDCQIKIKQIRKRNNMNEIMATVMNANWTVILTPLSALTGMALVIWAASKI